MEDFSDEDFFEQGTDGRRGPPLLSEIESSMRQPLLQSGTSNSIQDASPTAFGSYSAAFSPVSPSSRRKPPLAPLSAKRTPVMATPKSNGTHDTSPVLQSVSGGSSPSVSRQPFTPEKDSVMYTRMRLYQRLSSANLMEHAVPTPHVLPPELFFVIPPSKPGEKQGSFVTVFSIITTVVGSTFIVIPWGFSQSGIIAGFLSIFFVCLVCTYTGWLVAQHSSTHPDWLDVCEDYLRKPGKWTSWASSVGVLVGASSAYFIVMAQCLSSVISAISSNIGGNLSIPPFYIAVITLSIVIFPLLSMRKMGVFMRINSFGFIAVAIFVSFVLYKSSAVLRNVAPGTVFEGTELINVGWPYTAAILIMGFFIHNIAVEIFRNHRHEHRHGKVLAIAFSQAAILYAVVGFMGYIAFARFGSLPENFLDFFADSDWMAIIARSALLCQLLTVYPLVCFIIRIHFFGAIMGTPFPGWSLVLLLNFVLLGISVIVAIFIPKIGTVLRYTGSIAGLAQLFVLPTMTHLAKLSRRNSLKIWHVVVHGFIVLIGLVLLLLQFFDFS